MSGSFPRIRQVALVAEDLAATRTVLESGLGLRQPFADAGVGTFGLENAVYEAGSDFLEVVSPKQEGTTAGRWMSRIGGDGGYMVIFQLADFEELAAARARAREAGIREVWEHDGEDISSAHLHPKDTTGAIVSIDACRDQDSWRWGGPRWEHGQPADSYLGGGLTSVVIEVEDVEDTRRRWAAFLGCAPERLPSGQTIRLVPAAEGQAARGVIALEMAVTSPAGSVEVGCCVVSNG